MGDITAAAIGIQQDVLALIAMDNNTVPNCVLRPRWQRAKTNARRMSPLLIRPRMCSVASEMKEYQDVENDGTTVSMQMSEPIIQTNRSSFRSFKTFADHHNCEYWSTVLLAYRNTTTGSNVMLPHWRVRLGAIHLLYIGF